MCIFHGIAALAIVSLAAPTWAKAYWQAKEHSGACSNHGGVADWLDKSAPK